MITKSTESIPEVKSISMIGLGKLETPFAAALTHRGYHVIGVDTDPHKISSTGEGKEPVCKQRTESQDIKES